MELGPTLIQDDAIHRSLHSPENALLPNEAIYTGSRQTLPCAKCTIKPIIILLEDTVNVIQMQEVKEAEF